MMPSRRPLRSTHVNCVDHILRIAAIDQDAVQRRREILTWTPLLPRSAQPRPRAWRVARRSAAPSACRVGRTRDIRVNVLRPGVGVQQPHRRLLRVERAEPRHVRRHAEIDEMPPVGQDRRKETRLRRSARPDSPEASPRHQSAGTENRPRCSVANTIAAAVRDSTTAP